MGLLSSEWWHPAGETPALPGSHRRCGGFRFVGDKSRRPGPVRNRRREPESFLLSCYSRLIAMLRCKLPETAVTVSVKRPVARLSLVVSRRRLAFGDGA